MDPSGLRYAVKKTPVDRQEYVFLAQLWPIDTESQLPHDPAVASCWFG